MRYTHALSLLLVFLAEPLAAYGRLLSLASSQGGFEMRRDLCLIEV